MNDEIKEILRTLKAKSTRYEYCLKENISYNDESYEAHLLLDYITNLQQENEYLKKNNPEQNIEHFRIIKENKRKINNLREENKTLQENNQAMQEEMARVWEENERLKKPDYYEKGLIGSIKVNQFYYEHNDVRELLKENGNKEEVIKRQQKVIDQLTNNWNELEEWLEYEERHTIQQNNYHSVLDKMKEIKEGNK